MTLDVVYKVSSTWLAFLGILAYDDARRIYLALKYKQPVSVRNFHQFNHIQLMLMAKPHYLGCYEAFLVALYQSTYNIKSIFKYLSSRSRTQIARITQNARCRINY